MSVFEQLQKIANENDLIILFAEREKITPGQYVFQVQKNSELAKTQGPNLWVINVVTMSTGINNVDQAREKRFAVLSIGKKQKQ